MSGTFIRLNWIYYSIIHRDRLKVVSTLVINAFFLTASVPQNINLEINVARYGEVQIGNQVWMSKNLDVATFQNGDLIPEAKSNEEWEKAGKERRPAWCYYNNNVHIGRKYGRMYNWYALHDPRGVCPPGWHLPTLAEWIQFEKFVEGRQAIILFECGGDKSQKTNNQPNGFCVLAGGYRFSTGSFTGIDEFTYLSGVTEDEIGDSNRTRQPVLWGRGLHIIDRTSMRCGLSKDFGLYVRCIKN